MRLQSLLPVLVSITIIIVVAVLEKQNRAVAAITATMPVNVTLGLPIIRTSVDHGTAYDIAGTGVANASSLKAAIRTAVKMAENRAKGKGLSS